MRAIWTGVATISALALLGAATAALPAAGTGRGGHAMRGPQGRGGDRLATFLGLTDEQKATWEQMHQEFRDSMRATFEQQRPSMEKLREALDAAQPDPAAVGKLVLSMHQHRKQMEQRHEAFQQRLRAILTPEQQVKFDAFEALRPSHGRRGPGMFGPRGPGAPDGPEDEDPEGDAPFGPRGPRPERF